LVRGKKPAGNHEKFDGVVGRCKTFPLGGRMWVSGEIKKALAKLSASARRDGPCLGPSGKKRRQKRAKNEKPSWKLAGSCDPGLNGKQGAFVGP